MRPSGRTSAARATAGGRCAATNTGPASRSSHGSKAATAALQDRLRDEYAAHLTRFEELSEAHERRPTECPDEDTKSTLMNFVKSLGALRKNIEGVRVAEKEPHLNAGRAVDGLDRIPPLGPLLPGLSRPTPFLPQYAPPGAAEKLKREH